MSENIITNILDPKEADKVVDGGLVVTVSRQKGCGGMEVCEELLKKLNEDAKEAQTREWTLLSKEILEESAQYLNIHPEELDNILDRGFLDKLMGSFSQKDLPTDEEVKDSMRKVILKAAKLGNVIILGRGGAGLTREMENSLHVKLIAPYEHRVRQMASTEEYTLQEADKIIKSRDRQREAFNEYYHGDKEADMYLYDLTIDTSTMTSAEIAEFMHCILKLRRGTLVQGP